MTCTEGRPRGHRDATAVCRPKRLQELALPTPGSQTLGLRDQSTINFRCLSPTQSGAFVTAALVDCATYVTGRTQA